MLKLSFFHAFYAIFLLSCSETTDKDKNPQSQTAYDLENPTKVYKLPKALKEISGICSIGNNKIACVNDENGTIYIYDTNKNSIVDKFKFSNKGDFEDLTSVNEDYYILRSDGVIIKYSNGQTESFATPLKKPCNTEAFCYDQTKNRLLITCKEGASEIWEFDLKNKKFNKQAVSKIPATNFHTTAIAINKKENNNLYLLSKKSILVLDITGKQISNIELGESIFNQPEGITFNENGDLFISNEAKDQSANILEFKKQD